MDNHAYDGHEGRRSSLKKPTLATIHSGVGMDNQAFEMGEDHHVSTSYNRMAAGRPHMGRRMTHEAIPTVTNYSNLFMLSKKNVRPTVEELHESDLNNIQKESHEPIEEQPVRDKFGWFEGCLVRNMLNIFGVMLFLRISWVVAIAGIWQTFIIIGITMVITLVTAMSTSAITTNGEIGGGGTYYVMSRILGPEWGGSLGLLFAIANAINGALNVVGFVQTVQDAMKNYGGYIIVDGGLNDTRILGVILMILVWALCGAGAKYEMFTQQILLVILSIALANFVAGSIMGPRTNQAQARGFLGYSTELFNENWKADYVFSSGQLQNFFSVFSIYFPAGIGILAGANVSGDLKDPSTAIPKGTILAIIITSFWYALIAVICAGTTKRQATGSVDDLNNGTSLNCTIHNCTYGSQNDYQLMTLISAYGPLNYAGCFAATLSTALASYISCPKLMQVIGDDKLYPHWMVGFMTKGYGKEKEPHFAYLFTFFVSIAFILIAQLDIIAVLVADLFLITFAFLNYACFHVDFVQPTGWRPTFKYYNKWLSLFMALVCFAIMFPFDWRIALITVGIVLIFYFIVFYNKPQVNWGSSPQALVFREALTSIQQLAEIEEHVKNYQPQILAMSGLPGSRPAIVDFAYLICKKNSMLVCGNVLKEKQTARQRKQILNKSYKYLRTNDIKGFCALIDSADMPMGASAILQVGGVGKIKPNILLLGFKADWRTCEKASLDQYFATIHTGFGLNAAVMILRLAEGFDYSGILADEQDTAAVLAKSLSNGHQPSNGSTLSLETPPVTPNMERNGNVIESPSGDKKSAIKDTEKNKNKKSKKERVLLDTEGNPLPRHIVNNITVFSRKQNKGFIDIWWLYDDGGLTLLLPYIISTRANWANCKLRVFCTEAGHEDLDKEQEGMAELLARFRINYSDLIMLPDIDKTPKESTKVWFDGLIQHFIRNEEITENERIATQHKTDKHLRLREMLIDHSSDSNLVVMTLPMPRKGGVSAPMYMAWLEALTANMPPFLLVRGNQSSVMTYYA